MTSTRRDFLKQTLGTSALLSLGATAPSVLARAGSEVPVDGDGRVLVVLQLSGGNDGLNTVVPYRDDVYARSRPTLRWRADEVLKLDDGLGFHPSLAGCHRLFHEGTLGLVQGVGFPQATGDHDRDLRIWHSADPEHPQRQTGWLGRMVDGMTPRERLDAGAVFVGSIDRPFALHARHTVIPTVDSMQDLMMRQQVSAARAPGGSALLAYLQEAQQRARAQSARVRDLLAATATTGGAYPRSQLAQHLQIVAQCLRAQVGTRIYFVEHGGGGIGGFDNHANQKGNHGALLAQMSAAISAFVRDLQGDGLLDRVLLMTFSEFGRTLAENGRRGTGHGNAAPVFLAGGALRGGITGDPPSLTDLDGVALKYSIDFRQVYATALQSWLGMAAQPVLGGEFTPLEVLRV